MKIAIIIPTISKTRWPAIESIPLTERTTKHLDVEIVTIVSSGPGFTFSKSINAGLRKTPDADAWVLLNDDAFMDYGWLDNMITAMESHPEAGIIGAFLRFPDGSIQHAGAYVSSGWLDVRLLRLAIMILTNKPMWVLKHVLNSRLQMPGHHQRKLTRFTRLDTVTGACLMITRKCFETVGFFDEEYLLGFEDGDYCLRTREKGFDIVLAGNAAGIHHEMISVGHLGLDYAKDGSYDIFCGNWSFKRIKTALGNGRGIIHPMFCGCKGAK